MVKFFCVVTTVLFLFACSVGRYPVDRSSRSTEITRFYCSDNKNKPFNQLLLDSEFLYSEMQACLMKNNYDSATFLFSLAGSLSWYQAANDETGDLREKHTTLLGRYLQGIPPKNINQFWAVVHKNLGASDLLGSMCNKLSMFAIDIEQQGSKPNRYVTWKSALEHYLHCPLLD